VTTGAGLHLRSEPAPRRDASGAPQGKPRVAGVDVARGVALFGMMATHVLVMFDDSGPTTTTVVTVVAGRARGAVLRRSATPVGAPERE
jgi:hypothetical protein